MGKKEETLPAKVEAKDNLPASAELLNDMQQEAGAGIEEATRDDFAIPFLNVLQALSPQVDKENEAYIEGAEPGLIMDTVTKELFADLVVVPCHFEKMYNEWIPRKQGGGFVASYGTKAESDQLSSDENDVIDTANHYVLYKAPDGSWRQAVLSCTSTKLKQSRQWLTKLSMLRVPNGEGTPFTPPTFGTQWLLATARQQNQKGTFYNIALDYAGLVTDGELYAAAKNLRTAVSTGEKTVDYQKAQEAMEGAPAETSAF